MPPKIETPSAQVCAEGEIISRYHLRLPWHHCLQPHGVILTPVLNAHPRHLLHKGGCPLQIAAQGCIHALPSHPFTPTKGSLRRNSRVTSSRHSLEDIFCHYSIVPKLCQASALASRSISSALRKAVSVIFSPAMMRASSRTRSSSFSGCTCVWVRWSNTSLEMRR